MDTVPCPTCRGAGLIPDPASDHEHCDPPYHNASAGCFVIVCPDCTGGWVRK